MIFTDEQKQQLADKNLLQTAELALFAATLAGGIEEALKDDGKVGIMEGVKLALSFSGSAVDAFQGISTIPAEITTLDPEDVELLGDLVFPQLAGFPEYHQELASAAIGVTRELANFVQLIRRHNIPKAKVVDVSEGAD